MKNSNRVLIPINFKSFNDFQIQDKVEGGPGCNCLTVIASFYNGIEETTAYTTENDQQRLISNLKPECAPACIFPISS